jgi:hypothetical protein
MLSKMFSLRKLICNCEVRGHIMCKEMPVIPVNRAVYKIRIIGKNGGPRRCLRGRWPQKHCSGTEFCFKNRPLVHTAISCQQWPTSVTPASPTCKKAGRSRPSLTVTSAVILVFVPILSGFVYHDNFVSDMRRTLVTFDTSSFIYILAHCLW